MTGTLTLVAFLWLQAAVISGMWQYMTRPPRRGELVPPRLVARAAVHATVLVGALLVHGLFGDLAVALALTVLTICTVRVAYRALRRRIDRPAPTPAQWTEDLL